MMSGSGTGRSRSSSTYSGGDITWDSSLAASKPLRWYPSHSSPDSQMHHSRSASNFRGLETIDEDMPSTSRHGGQGHANKVSSYPEGSSNSRSPMEGKGQQGKPPRRHSEGDLLELSSPNRYNKKAQAPSNGAKRLGASGNERHEGVRQHRRKSSGGTDITPDYDASSDNSDAYSMKSSKSRLSAGSEDSLTSASRLDARRRSEADGISFGKTSSTMALVPNEARRKSAIGNETFQNGEKRLSISNGVEAPKLQPSRRLSALTIAGEEPSPFATLEIPVELLDNPTSRVRKLLAPVVICLIVVTLLASLAVAVYFAIILKDSQEKQIEFLQVTLKLRLARDGELRNLNRLTSSEQEELKRAYCTQVDQFYRSSHINPNYRGCEVNVLTNERIEFKLYLLDNPEMERQAGSVIDVLASQAPLVGQQGSELRKIGDITVDVSNKSRSVTVEKTRRPEGFYSGSGSNVTRESHPQEATSNLVKHEASNSVEDTAAGRITTTTTATASTLMTTTSTTRPSTTTTTTSTTATKEAVTTVTLDPVIDGKSTVLNDTICSSLQPGEIVAHPGDCTHYIQCEFTKPIVRPCSGGLVFNPAISACVTPTPELPCMTVKPCENMNGGYFPHPTNCNLYIICDQGHTIIQSCQNNFSWDNVSKTCILTQEGHNCTSV